MSYLYDTHIHTSVGSHCSQVLPEEAVHRFKKMGYTGIFITDHFFNNPSTTVPYKDIPWREAVAQYCVPYERAKAEGDKVGLDVFFGFENSYQGNDILTFGLGQDLNITKKEAEGYINQYFEAYPKLKTYLDHLVIQAKETGFVTTLYGRKRPIPEITSSNFMQRNFGERIAMNSPIQGTAADIMKIAMLRVKKALKEQGLQTKILLQIHDELLLEAPKDEAEQVAKILKEEMMAAASLSVPLSVEVKIGENWYETK